MNDDLGDHGVVEGGDDFARTTGSDNVDGLVIRHHPFGYFPGVGAEHQLIANLRDLLGVQPHLDGVAIAAGGEVLDGCAARHPELLSDDINATNLFRNRVLYLEARVHLHEVHGVIHYVEDELHRPRAHVVHLMGQGKRAFSNLGLKRRRQGR